MSAPSCCANCVEERPLEPVEFRGRVYRLCAACAKSARAGKLRDFAFNERAPGAAPARGSYAPALDELDRWSTTAGGKGGGR